ncbi:MAG: glycosyltransferase family 9 protein [Planctomycetota bacterium]
MSGRRILFIKLSAIGDVIHTLPALRALKTLRPDWTVDWVAESPAAGLLQGDPTLETVHIVAKSKRPPWHRLAALREAGRILRRTGYDAAVDFQGLAKSGWLARASGAPLRVGFAWPRAREGNFLFTNRRLTPPRDIPHIVDQNRWLLTGLDIRPDELASVPVRFDLFIPGDARARTETLLNPLCPGGTSFVLLHPGAQRIVKRWPFPHYAALARGLLARQSRPVFLSAHGGEERRFAESLAAAAPGLVLLPEMPLTDLAALTSRTSLFIGGDTGPLHIAAALGVPTVALFGPTEASRNGPYGTGNTILATSASCAPCWKRDCGYPLCLGLITPGEVLAAALKRLASDTPSPVAENCP